VTKKKLRVCKLYAVSKSIATGGYTLEDWFFEIPRSSDGHVKI